MIADVLCIDLDDVLAIAGHRPLDPALKPDDPVARLCGLVKRVQWNEDQARGIESQLRSILDWYRTQEMKG